MKVAVVGGGAIGLLFAAPLSKIRSTKLTLFTRTENQADEINRHGVSFTSIDGEHSSVSLNVASRPNRKTGWDLILLMVKQVHLTETFVSKFAARFVSPHTSILCFQNGLGHMEILQKFIPRKQLMYAITTEGALRTSLNSLTHTGKGKTIIESDATGRMNAVVDLLKEAGFSAELSKNNIESVIWNKLLINACINPLTALFRVQNGELVKRRKWRDLMFTLLEEGQHVANSLKIEIAQHLDEQLISICEQTAMNESSMLQDLSASRQTEIDYINGSIVRLADKHGLSVPVQRAVWQMIKGLDATL